MLTTLKYELKTLVRENRLRELFARLLDEVVAVNSNLYNNLTSLAASFNQLGTQEAAGIISFENNNLKFNSVSHGLLHFIDLLQESDLRSDVAGKVSKLLYIPSYHAYAVNRSVQAEQFELDTILGEDPDCRVFFHYLRGDLRQEAQSFIRRLSYEISGRQLTAASLTDDYQRPEPIFIECKPEPRNHVKLFHISLLKCLMEKFIGPVNDMRALLSKTLLHLLPSPKLQGLPPRTPVFINVSLDHHNWNADVVPPVLASLYETMCSCELPPESPVFYFFFGIEYPQQNATVQAEVAAAIANSKYGSALEELQAVPTADVEAWFSRHRPILKQGEEADVIAAALFPPAAGRTDMVEVEKKLTELIEDHNKGIALNNR